MSKDNTRIFCNEQIPEGRMVCPVCEEALRNIPTGKYTTKSFLARLKREAKRPFEVLNAKRLISQSVAKEYDAPKSRTKGTIRPEIIAIPSIKSEILLL